MTVYTMAQARAVIQYVRKPDFEKYVREGGNYCPYCESWQIESGPVEIDGMYATVTTNCVKCGNSWDEGYKLDYAVPS